MKKLTASLICIGLFVTLLAACGKNNDPITYETLTEEDIQQFAETYKIDALAVDTVYGITTVFIFGDLYTSGYYEAYKTDGVVKKGRKVISEGDWSDAGPIVFSGGTASGDYPFAVLYILDDTIISQNNILEVIGEKGSTKIDITKKAYAIETSEIGRIDRYRLINSSGEVLLDERKE